MKRLSRTNQFKKDVKRMLKRGKDVTEFKIVIQQLLEAQELAMHYRDHALVGQYKGTRECHIAPDWLLIYEVTDTEIILIRTGTHSDLFA
ncbi:MAG: type II toxin-antitoxin system YafQ family toxin [Chloroflexi bacterium]|nr:MAG: type II toxin-antitoxin system YafQ family toxin [Chloroflexota bacterium]